MRRRHARMPDCFVMTFITPHSDAARAHFSSPSDFMIYLLLEGAARVGYPMSGGGFQSYIQCQFDSISQGKS